MIYRPNYEDVQRYLVYVRETMQRDEETVQNHRATLYVLLEWADSTPLPDCKTKPCYRWEVVQPLHHLPFLLLMCHCRFRQ